MLAGDNGQTTKDKSTSVVLASDHAAVPVTITNASVDLTVDIDASNLATHADALAINTKQTDGNQKTKLVDTTNASLFPDAAAPADSMAATAMSKIVSYLAAFNGSSFMLIRAGLTTITATIAGYQNVIPSAFYRATPPTRTDTQQGPLEADSTGNLRIGEQYQPGYEDNAAGVAKVEERYNSTYITGTGTTVVKSGAGYCDCITIGTPATGTVTIYDNTAASGTIIAKLTLVAGMPFSVPIHYAFVTGLTVVVATAGQDVRVGWR